MTGPLAEPGVRSGARPGCAGSAPAGDLGAAPSAACSMSARCTSTCSRRVRPSTTRARTRTTPRWCCAPTVGDTRILLPGDAEVEAQQAMMSAGIDIRADVLKVAAPRLGLLRPGLPRRGARQLAVISVGPHNDYGHPSPAAARPSSPGSASRCGAPISTATSRSPPAAPRCRGRARRRGEHGGSGSCRRRRPRRPSPPVATARMGACHSMLRRMPRDGLAGRPARPAAAARPARRRRGTARHPGRRRARRRARARDPDVTETERAGGELDGPGTARAARPVAVRRCPVGRRARGAGHPGRGRDGARAVPRDAGLPARTLVLQHAGGAKGKAVLEAARQAEARWRSAARSSPAPTSGPISCVPRCAAAGGRIDAGRVSRCCSTRSAAICASSPRCRAAGQRLRRHVDDRSGARVPPRPGGGERVRGVRPGRGRATAARRTRGAAVRAVGRRAARGHRRRACRRGPHRWRGSPRPGRGDQYTLAQEAGHAAVEGQAGRESEPRLDRAGPAARAGRGGRAQRRRQGRRGRPGYALERAVRSSPRSRRSGR